MISKVLNKAQNITTSAHYSLLQTCSRTPTRSSSSKLLASISKKVETWSSSCFEDDPLPSQPVSSPVRTTPKVSSREPSSIVSYSNNVSRNDEEAMDFENVNSVLSKILSDPDMPSSATEAPSLARASNEARSTPSRRTLLPRQDTFLSDLSNNTDSKTATSGGWNAWRFDVNTEANDTWRWSGAAEIRSTEPEDVPTAPLSPGKRHHQEAFPADDKENALLVDGLLYDGTKRFKSCPPEGCPLESLPGFCGYLSPKNLQSAPLITYMFGKGFTEPSNPSTSDWPSSFSPHNSSTDCQAVGVKSEVPAYPATEHHFAPHFQSPVSPILAF